MHNAPSVSYPVGRSRFLARLQCVLWLLGVVAVAAWFWQLGALGWRQMLAAVGVALAGWVAMQSWWRMPSGFLRWDGQQWFWMGSGEPCEVRIHVHLDLQRHLLLSLRSQSGVQLWCWVEQASQPQRWDDLRRAVYSPARAQAERDSALLPEP